MCREDEDERDCRALELCFEVWLMRGDASAMSGDRRSSTNKLEKEARLESV